MTNLGLALIEISASSLGVMFDPVEIEVWTAEQAERVVSAVQEAGLMAHVEDHETYFVVYVATPQWVRQYYSSGGIWDYDSFPADGRCAIARAMSN